MNSNLQTPTPLMNLRQVAAYLNYSTRTIHRLVQQGQLRACRPNRKSLRFRFADVEALIMVTASPEVTNMKELDSFINQQIHH